MYRTKVLLARLSFKADKVTTELKDDLRENLIKNLLADGDLAGFEHPVDQITLLIKDSKT